MTDVAQREAAATEKRKWVRTIRACNNRCTFCLDTGMLDGFVVPPDAVKEEIRQGREERCARLILSGGEASIHPNFLEFVRYGRALGYTWIQTISNGRRFYYHGFVRKAAASGLNEVTFSIHGHTPELHDALTGVEGAFHQALRGLVNVRKAGLVANIDIVLNKKNVPHLKEMLDFFEGLGVHEFDLLWLVPFGRGFDENREALFLPPGEAFPHIQRALEGRRRPGLYLWTNRFPVEYLEGYEWLIQEPYKLFDEVNGRREMFEEFGRVGDEALGCRGERCPHCFLQRFCPVLRRYRRRLETPSEAGFPAAALDATAPQERAALARFAAELARHPVRRLELHARTAAEARDALDTLPEPVPPVALRLDELGEARSLPEPMARLVVWRTADLAAAREALEARPELEIELEANADTADLLAALAGDEPPLPLARTIVVVRNHSRLTQVHANEISSEIVRAALAALPAGAVRVRNLPPCLAGGQTLEAVGAGDDALVPGLVDADGRLDPFTFTGRFIEQHYHAKSLRCAGCVHDANCPGLHINAVRAWGFAVLTPERG